MPRANNPSSSINRAQVPMYPRLCNFCEIDLNTKWRCIQCDVFLCNRCKNIHSKVKTFAQHEIVDSNKDISAIQTKIITDNIPCRIHRKNCCLFCGSCEVLVCLDCVVSSHNSHPFQPIEKVISERVEQLKKSEADIEIDRSRCQTKVKEIKSIETKYDSLFQETIDKIQLREHKVKDAITKYSKLLQDEIRAEQKNGIHSLSLIQQKIDQEEKKIVEQADKIRTTLKSNQGKVIFEASSGLKYTSSLTFDPLPTDNQFTSGEDLATSIPSLFGYLKIQKKQQAELFGFHVDKSRLPQPVKPKIDFEILRTFETDFPIIEQLLCIDESSAWILLKHNHQVLQIVIEEHNNKTIRTISLYNVYALAKTPNNEILLSLSNSSDIKIPLKTGEVKPYLSVSPLETIGIHVSSDNNILVGVKEKGGSFNTTEKSVRAVLVFGINLQKTYQYDRYGKELFTWPYRITTNTVNDILVIDRTSESTGRVVVLNKEGDFKWIYEGHDYMSHHRANFNPLGIVTTTSGNIVVIDHSTNALHVLSRERHILLCKSLNGINNPCALDIDSKEQLWVGSTDGNIRPRCTIHIVKLLY